MRKGNPTMKKRFIAVVSIVLSLCFLFLTGCNVEKTNTQNSTNTPSETLESETVAQTTEEALDETTEIETEKDIDIPVAVPSPVKPTKPAKVPAPVVTVPATVPAPVKKDVDSFKWNPAGVYNVGHEKNMLVPGEYYVLKTGSKQATVNIMNKRVGREVFHSYLVTLNAGDKIYIENCKIINTQSEHPHADASGRYQSGIYKIGRDIPAQTAEFVLRQTGSYGRFGIVSDTQIDGNFDDLRGTVKNFGYATMTLESGKYLYLDRCSLEAKTDKPITKPSGSIYPQGMYLVGKDIPAGEYIARPIADRPGLYVYNSSAFPRPNPVKSPNFPKSAQDTANKEILVSFEAGQYVLVDNATLEKRPSLG